MDGKNEIRWTSPMFNEKWEMMDEFCAWIKNKCLQIDCIHHQQIMWQWTKNERWNSFDGWKKMLIESISSIMHYAWKLEGHR
jgi:hypothetical protein